MKKIISSIVLIFVIINICITYTFAYEIEVTKENLQYAYMVYTAIVASSAYPLEITINDSQIIRKLTGRDDLNIDYELSNNPTFCVENTINNTMDFKEMGNLINEHLENAVYGLIGVYGVQFDFDISKPEETDNKIHQIFENGYGGMDGLAKGLGNQKICEFVDYLYQQFGKHSLSRDENTLTVTKNEVETTFEKDSFDLDSYIDLVIGDGITATNGDFSYNITKIKNSDGSYTLKSTVTVDKNTNFFENSNVIKDIEPTPAPEENKIVPINSNPTEKTDTTVATKILPAAGKSALIVVIIASAIIALVSIKIVLKKYKDIK